MSRPPLPPFTAETAAQKARGAEDAWNTREPTRVALAYSENSRWRNRAEFFSGRAAIEAFLTRKWNRELDYRLIKEVWGGPARPIDGLSTNVQLRYAKHAEISNAIEDRATPFIWRCRT
jgi:nuclear transport factor 2 (NTF2) superfamily protein